MKSWKKIRRQSLTGVYDPDKDLSNTSPANFTDHVNQVLDEAVRARNKCRARKKRGSYSSKGAQASPAVTAATDRMVGEPSRKR
jgi:hypothetical protein